METKFRISCHRNELVPNNGTRLPESPRVQMEFLSRSWSAFSLEVSKALQPPQPSSSKHPIPEETTAHSEQLSTMSGNQFSFASAATSQIVLTHYVTVHKRALRGAETLKARASKEVCNVTTVTPIERGIGIGLCGRGNNNSNSSTTDSGEIVNGENFLGACNQELRASGAELLKRTRGGDLHWKIISVYIHRTGEVMLKMKNRHVAGTITKKKKNTVLDVCTSLPAWPGRHLFDDGEQRKYFGLKSESRGIVEFECRNQSYEIWTQGVSRLLSIVAQRQNRYGI